MSEFHSFLKLDSISFIGIPHFCYSFICPWTSGSVLPFGYYKRCFYYEHLCTNMSWRHYGVSMLSSLSLQSLLFKPPAAQAPGWHVFLSPSLRPVSPHLVPVANGMLQTLLSLISIGDLGFLGNGLLSSFLHELSFQCTLVPLGHQFWSLIALSFLIQEYNRTSSLHKGKKRNWLLSGICYVLGTLQGLSQHCKLHLCL